MPTPAALELPRSAGHMLSPFLTSPQTVKMGVQYSLWGGSILNLGTERHRKAYFDDIDKFRLPGEPAQSVPWLGADYKASKAAQLLTRRGLQAVLP